ncbi:hypothetical protein FNF31_04015 [Cafeteria roenbergensis]|uniref:Lipoyl-binding domain-containing protein n=1 Tax=Cafeteria roenbergensis TaxID=33653 RepID=A0A5A8D667_CAFRO|nr:hypothetical protein FNF31_04015 [Cafeteria roenbergensis]
MALGAVRRAVLAARPVVQARWLALHAVKVPSLGDSVPNGSILTLTKSPGDQVAVDDVLLVIETDKVTLDVRAEVSGVLQSFSVGEGDDVDVGADLAVIDTDGTAAAAPAKEAGEPAAAAAPAPPAAPAKQSPAAPAPAPAHSAGHRTPLIQFRHGKANREALASKQAGKGSPAGSSAASAAAAAGGSWDEDNYEFRPSKATQTLEDLPSMFGRPPLSATEMDAIDMGGCVV